MKLDPVTTVINHNLGNEQLDEDWSWILYCVGGETLEQVAQWGCGCPLPGTIQGQAGWGFEQPGLVRDLVLTAGGLELDDLKGLFEPKSVHDSMILWKPACRKGTGAMFSLRTSTSPQSRV